MQVLFNSCALTGHVNVHHKGNKPWLLRNTPEAKARAAGKKAAAERPKVGSAPTGKKIPAKVSEIVATGNDKAPGDARVHSAHQVSVSSG
ncbi:hypothetical protein AB0F43_14150 [Kribbella sp. NPDC023972]|uniref:hypothetical protein n=1 Tax=Kribbella sp. NPDC023972 TaxID=3154795 RepID=UPI0033CAE03A